MIAVPSYKEGSLEAALCHSLRIFNWLRSLLQLLKFVPGLRDFGGLSPIFTRPLLPHPIVPIVNKLQRPKWDIQLQNFLM